MDLAREPAIRLNGLDVRPSTREIIHGNNRVVVEPQVMAVLLVLARARGEVVSRDRAHMAAIGRALMARPRLLMLDEPSLGLSPILTKEIYRIIARINMETGTTLLLVEQNAAIALASANDGYVLELGRIVAAGTCTELAQKDDVKEFYLGAGSRGSNSHKRRWKRRKTWR